MSLVFISYADEDKLVAEQVHTCLLREGVDAFMAGISLKPGARWSQAIIDALLASKAVFYLASEASNSSQFVQQELGIAISSGKRIIPIVWNMEPERLPGFLRDFQAIDVRHHNDPDGFAARLALIAASITEETSIAPNAGISMSTALVIAAVLIFVLVVTSKA